MINSNFLHLSESYLFSEIAHRVDAYKASHPESQVISLGIGDVTRPLPKVCIEAMHRAVDEMADAATFRGYGPEQGYAFLREAIVTNDYRARGVDLNTDEVFVSDGAKSDCGNIGDILSVECPVGVMDPVYPVYIDSNTMVGRAIHLLHGVPTDDSLRGAILYLCYPNNPTGATLTRNQLASWVDYALRTDSLIIYDSAYEAYIRHDDIPHSIYEIDGAKRCAIELRSYSKTAGFTGLRCGYTVVPKELVIDGVSLHHMWLRRQTTKFNGTSYVTQRAAEAIYSLDGQRQIHDTIDYYMRNATYLRQQLTRLGYEVSGGEDAPYLWLRVPEQYDSWSFFDHLLSEYALVTTPGVGFGPAGEGYVRLTAFGSYENTIAAVARLAGY